MLSLAGMSLCKGLILCHCMDFLRGASPLSDMCALGPCTYVCDLPSSPPFVIFGLFCYLLFVHTISGILSSNTTLQCIVILAVGMRYL